MWPLCSLFHPSHFLSLSRWISIVRSPSVFLFLSSSSTSSISPLSPFSLYHSASLSFSCNENIPVARRGESLLVIFFSPCIFSLSLFPSLHREEASRMKSERVTVFFFCFPCLFLAPTLLASLPRPHLLTSLPPPFFSSSRKKERREEIGESRGERN